MRDLDALVAQMGERLGAMIQPMFRQLEADLTAKLAAGTIREALIDRGGGLVLTFGDGSMKALGSVVGQPGADHDPTTLALLTGRVDALDGRALVDATLDGDRLVLTLGDGTTRDVGAVVGPAGAAGPEGPAGPMGGPDVDALAEVDARLSALASGALVEASLDGGVLVLRMGDGTTREVGPVVGPTGPAGPPGPKGSGEDAGAAVEALQGRLGAIEARTLTDALIERDGRLVLVFADGSSRAVGQVVGRDGVDGKDGADGQDGAMGQPGLGFEDMTLALDDNGRTLRVTFDRGDAMQEFQLDFPVLIYRGVYRPETDYVRGDAVTFGGSAWVCGQPTQARPGETEGAWTLAVKRGRDGKDFAGPRGGDK
jgi:integrin beta 3